MCYNVSVNTLVHNIRSIVHQCSYISYMYYKSNGFFIISKLFIATCVYFSVFDELCPKSILIHLISVHFSRK